MSREDWVSCTVGGNPTNSASPPQNSPLWFRDAVHANMDYFSGPDGEGQDLDIDGLWSAIQARKRKQRRAA